MMTKTVVLILIAKNRSSHHTMMSMMTTAKTTHINTYDFILFIMKISFCQPFFTSSLSFRLSICSFIEVYIDEYMFAQFHQLVLIFRLFRNHPFSLPLFDLLTFPVCLNDSLNDFEIFSPFPYDLSG